MMSQEQSLDPLETALLRQLHEQYEEVGQMAINAGLIRKDEWPHAFDDYLEGSWHGFVHYLIEVMKNKGHLNTEMFITDNEEMLRDSVALEMRFGLRIRTCKGMLEEYHAGTYVPKRFR